MLKQEERSKIFSQILSYFDLLSDIILKYVMFFICGIRKLAKSDPIFIISDGLKT